MPSTRAIQRARPPRGGFLGAFAYLGGMGLLAFAAIRAGVRPRVPAPRLVPTVFRHLDRLLMMGLPLVALVHVPLGSFLAMQAFFSATFREATGAVVGVGLVRNLAPLMSGFTLAALLAARNVPELRRRSRVGLDEDPSVVVDRDVSLGLRPDDRPEPDAGRLALVRILAALIAGPTLAVWGAFIGMLVGMLVAGSMLSVSPGIYFNKFWEMIVPFDAVGLVVKAMLFALAASLFACHEGLRGTGNPRKVPVATCRAVCFAIMTMLVANGSWFTLNFVSGPPFGPMLGAR